MIVTDKENNTQSWTMGAGLKSIVDSEIAKLNEIIDNMESDIKALNEYIAHLEQRLRDKVKWEKEETKIVRN